jgi:ring-1,2-phenylacetyl-CoA epoxidase subunit PaaE
MFADELADLKDAHPTRFDLTHVLSREPREAELLSGRLDANRLASLLPILYPVGQVGHWWLCGPAGMVADARRVLDRLGVRRAAVHQELFGGTATRRPREPPPVTTTDVASEVTVVLDGRATTTTQPRDVTILDAPGGSAPTFPSPAGPVSAGRAVTGAGPPCVTTSPSRTRNSTPASS